MKQTTPSYDHLVGIIGAGFGGLGAAIRLQNQGYDDFIILEGADEVGGTWRENIYPGCACDVPSHLYSFSFEHNRAWSAAYAEQPEILEYLKTCTDKHELRQKIHFKQHVTSMVLDEEELVWVVQTRQGKTWRFKLLVAAIGPLHVPKIPDFEGRDAFEGVQMHSATWRPEVSLKDKRVAVVGTGASAIQLVPRIATEVASLKVFQRSAPWVFPKSETNTARWTQRLFKTIPATQPFLRQGLYWFMEYTGSGLFRDNMIRRITERMAEDYLTKQVPDSALRDRLRPNYTVGCKRRLPSDDYYPTFLKEHVALETQGIERLSPKGIVDASGNTHEVDVIIYATGFHVADFTKRNMEVRGLNGKELFKNWTEKGAEAYFGTTVSDYPGLFYILGPNTGLGHSSVLHMVESQINYFLDYIKQLQAQPAGALLNVLPEAQDAYNKKIQQQLASMVWSDGSCTSWYLDDRGRNATMWPGHTTAFRRKTKRLRLKDYQTLTPSQFSQSS